MRIRWDVDPNEIKAKVRYCAVGTSTWLTKNSTPGNNYIYITGLAPNATYQYGVRSNCDGNDWSAYSGSYFHDLSGAGARMAEEVTTATTRVYPNPTRDILNVELEISEREEVSITISNNLGKVVHTQHMIYHKGIQQATIDMNSLANGYYFATIRKGEEVETIKVIKIE